jgi:predicted TIM-barrel fold metal-dependent hydrolase
VDFEIFDADEHYYEAEDAFTRYASQRMRDEKYIRWIAELDGKRKRLFAGGREVNVIGNPTFNPVARPGVYLETLKNLDVSQDRSSAAYGMLEAIRPEYRDRNVRLKWMDEQGIDKALLFPTLGVTMEGFLLNDVEMHYDAFHAFNRWLIDDWGFAHENRLYAAPYLSLMDLDRAVEELDWVLKQGARLITLRPGPAFGRSPADPYFDPFWSRVNESGVLVTYHAYEGPSDVSEALDQLWCAPPRPKLAEDRLLRNVVYSQDTAIMNTMFALVLHNLFGRFLNIRVATIEMGGGWVPYCLHKLDTAGGFMPRRISAFGMQLPDKPSDIFREKVWVSPFPEEDVEGLVGLLGADRVLMGSDWPHAEGVARPRDYEHTIAGLSAADKRKIMRDNTLGLIRQ